MSLSTFYADYQSFKHVRRYETYLLLEYQKNQAIVIRMILRSSFVRSLYIVAVEKVRMTYELRNHREE